jgi:hypothetical protein
VACGAAGGPSEWVPCPHAHLGHGRDAACPAQRLAPAADATGRLCRVPPGGGGACAPPIPRAAGPARASLGVEACGRPIAIAGTGRAGHRARAQPDLSGPDRFWYVGATLHTGAAAAEGVRVRASVPCGQPTAACVCGGPRGARLPRQLHHERDGRRYRARTGRACAYCCRATDAGWQLWDARWR